ncbi:hypothetical protein [Mesorhizobium sp.]|uniref:hypothetical protein n=1 Tax=Mesorhizobium sp. TaxID=1871066 RepID=UPI0011F95D48|nr:hypothetical protein [Mesorhizobium sp.]TIN82197.1 MAG: hypothetical protein E5X97_31220 [Mesorhizobium sp.]
MTSRPLTQPIADNGNPEWLQIIGLFERYGMSEPPTRLRDELVTLLAWARYGQELDAERAGINEEREQHFRLVSALVQAAGGKITIPAQLLRYIDDRVEIVREEDAETRDVTYRVKT